MKIAIISDVHSNFAALKAFPEEHYDQLWCLGDLVDYGPRPRESIDWIRRKAQIVVCGNHDQAVGFDTDPRCSAPFKKLAAATMRYTRRLCTVEDFAFLRGLPTQCEIQVGSVRFYLVHAKPSDPLFGYCSEMSEEWRTEVEQIDADVLLVGHTHTPFVKKVGKTTILNPGSIGQPKTGRSLSCYAVWEDGIASLKEYEYPLAETIGDIRGMPIAAGDQDSLVAALETGKPLPPR